MQMQQESSNNRNESSSAPTATPAIVPLSPCCTPTSSHSESTRWSETLNPDSQPQSSSIEEWGAFSSPTIDNCYLSARPEHIRAHGFDVPGAVQSIVTPSTFSTWKKKKHVIILMFVRKKLVESHIQIANWSSSWVRKRQRGLRLWKTKLALYLVGLPARGKSYIVKKLRRYLNWLQYETKVEYNGMQLSLFDVTDSSHERCLMWVIFAV